MSFTFLSFLKESQTSDAYERAIADNINEHSKELQLTAKRPGVGTAYSDVLCTDTVSGKQSWIEVKMNHSDNLGNPRFFYKNGKWQTTYETPIASIIVDELNQSKEANKFIKDIAKFCGINPKDVFLPTTLSGLREENAVSLEQMIEFCENIKGNRYILKNDNYDVSKLVREHYIHGKAEPVYYIQTGDDFFRLHQHINPLQFKNIPILSGRGSCSVRVSTRSKFYEIQAEIKLKNIVSSSKYSLKPNSKKLLPERKL